MKKTKMILACLAVAVALGGLTGCMLPDYQLDMDVTITTSSGGAGINDYADVSYYFRNRGNKDLRNVQITIEVLRYPSAGGDYNGEVTDTLGPFSIDVGDYVEDTERYYFGDDSINSSFEVFVTSVGWDANE